MQHVFHHFNLLAEGVYIRRNRALEMAHLAFVVVAHVDEDGLILGRQLIERFRIQVHTGLADIKRVVVEAVRHNFVAHLDGQFEEGFAFMNGVIEANTVQERNAVQVGFEILKPISWDGNLGIDAFVRHIGAAHHSKFIPVGKQVVAKEGGVQDVRILVKGNRYSTFLICLHALQEHLPVDQIAQLLLHAITSHSASPARRVRNLTFGKGTIIGFAAF